MAKKPTTRIELMRLDEFEKRSHPDNPKSHDLSAIGRSIDQFGFVEMPTIDERTGYVVAGHGRGKELLVKMQSGETAPARIEVDADGMWMIPVIRGISFNSDAQVKAYLVASNKLTERGGWDMDKLEALRVELDDDLWAITGFGEDDLFGGDGLTGEDNFDLSEFSQPELKEIAYRVAIPELGKEQADMLAQELQSRFPQAKVEQYRKKGEGVGMVETIGEGLDFAND